jgi:hypothetical protein
MTWLETSARPYHDIADVTIAVTALGEPSRIRLRRRRAGRNGGISGSTVLEVRSGM